MVMSSANNFPKLHNAMWPGLVGKGPDSEPPIDLDTMIKLTTAATIDGRKFDGIDLFLAEPHTSIDARDDELKQLADKVQSHNLDIGSCVAPVWEPTGGGSTMGDAAGRKAFLDVVQKACQIGSRLTELGVRSGNVIRIDSSCSPADWSKDPTGNTQRIARTFREASDIATDYGQRLAAEGEICWGGMHSWKYMLDTLEAVDRPGLIGFQADMAHTLLYTMGYNAPEHRLIPEARDLDDRDALDTALRQVTDALRPWTIDFHVAQNDGTVHGTGSHDKTGRHCLADDPDGKLDIAYHAGFWLRDSEGSLTKACNHICWDGCMFSNEQMMQSDTWNNILKAMIKVRELHGWSA